MSTTTPIWPPPPVTFSCCPPYPPFCPPSCPSSPCPQYLPLTTGRVGLSQGTGQLEFYGFNQRGTGIQNFHGNCTNWTPCLPLGGWSGTSFSNALAAVLTGKCA